MKWILLCAIIWLGYMHGYSQNYSAIASSSAVYNDALNQLFAVISKSNGIDKLYVDATNVQFRPESFHNPHVAFITREFILKSKQERGIYVLRPLELEGGKICVFLTRYMASKIGKMASYKKVIDYKFIYKYDCSRNSWVFDEMKEFGF